MGGQGETDGVGSDDGCDGTGGGGGEGRGDTNRGGGVGEAGDAAAPATGVGAQLPSPTRGSRFTHRRQKWAWPHGCSTTSGGRSMHTMHAPGAVAAAAAAAAPAAVAAVVAASVAAVNVVAAAAVAAGADGVPTAVVARDDGRRDGDRDGDDRSSGSVARRRVTAADAAPRRTIGGDGQTKQERTGIRKGAWSGRGSEDGRGKERG